MSESTAEKSDQERHFTTLARRIAFAAREQGGDPADNFRLRVAERQAHEANMPDSQIEQARRRGLGEIKGAELEERLYEGYGTNGVAVLVETISENARKTASALEQVFEEYGGNLGQDGCVAWQFERRGFVDVDSEDIDDADDFMLEVIEMGAQELSESVVDRGGREGQIPTFRIYCDPTDLSELDHALTEAGYPVRDAAVAYEATQHIPLEASDARKFVGFVERLLELEDVQDVWANWELA